MTTDEKHKTLEAAGYVFDVSINMVRNPANVTAPDGWQIFPEDSTCYDADDYEDCMMEILIDKAEEHYQRNEIFRELAEMGRAYLSPKYGSEFGGYENRQDEQSIDISYKQLRLITRTYFGLDRT